MADYQGTWDGLPLSPSAGEVAISEDQPTGNTTGNKTQLLKYRRLAEVFGTNLWVEAKHSPNGHYVRDITTAVPDEELRRGKGWGSYISARDLYLPRPGDRFLDRDGPIQLTTDGESAYDGTWAELLNIDFPIFLRDTVGLDHRIWKERGSFIEMDELYEALETDGGSQ